jgi:hypothetical protein
MWDIEYWQFPELCDVSSTQCITIVAIALPPPPKHTIPQWGQKWVGLTIKIADIEQIQQFQLTPAAEDVPDPTQYYAKRLNSPQ